MSFDIRSFLQGEPAINYSEVPLEKLIKEYEMYLMSGEEIVMGFKLIRDALIFTDKRIIMTDKQGATGMKMCIKSINLFSIVEVQMETSGFGFDDSEITFTYISSPELRGHHVTYENHKLEFPKKYDTQTIYRLLQELAYENCLKLNGLD